VVVVFQDLFTGAFFSATLVTVIIFCFAHLSRYASGISCGPLVRGFLKEPLHSSPFWGAMKL